MVAKNTNEVALKIILVELVKTVASQTRKTAKFRTVLKRLDKTLRNIEPILYENGRLARVLDRPERETKIFIFYLENGKEIVLKCSRIKCWNVYKKFVHANKLIRLDHELSRFFQVELQDNLTTRIKGLTLGGEVNQVLSSITKQAGGFSSSINVLGLPDVIVGLDFHLREVKHMLFKEDIQVLTISAPGGCGKTTLAKMLCYDNEIKGIFGDNIFYVTVSRTTSLKTVVQKLFTHHLHVNNCEFLTDEEAKNELENMMRQMGSQKILLVLDDVWSESESLIQDLKFPIQGYTILVTSRFKFPRIGSTYELSLLNDEDARTLLCHLAFPCDMNPISVPDDFVNKMVKCCKGFPLALTVIGASLRNQGVLKWRTTLENWSEGRQSIFDSNTEILLSLRASFDALEDSSIARDCFLDLASFPEDEKISASALMDMWVILYNLDNEGMYTMEYLLELSSRNLLTLAIARKDASELEGYCNEHYVTQHDLLRELAIYLSSQEPIAQSKRVLIEIYNNNIPAWWIDQTQLVDTRLLSISTDETFSSVWCDLKAPKLQALVLNIRSKVYTLPHFIKNFNELKVLNITSYGIYPTELHELPLINSLSNLRRLRLEHISLSLSVHSIFELKNLEKLSLIMCEIGNALEGCTVDPPMLPNLIELEIESCYDLKEVPIGLCCLNRLEKLSITNCHELNTLPEGLGCLSLLETLRLHSCTRLSKLPESIGKLHRLVFLDISDCLGINSLPDQIGELNALRVLKMSGCHGLEELPDSVNNLTLLEDVICDEETSYLWSYYESDLCDLRINIVEEDRLANFMKIVG